MTATSTALPRCRPGEAGVDANGVAALLDAVAQHGLELHSLMVLRHGHVVAEGWWSPYTPQRKHLLYSLSKSFTSTAVGLAVDAGLVSPDDRVLDHLGDHAGDAIDERYDRLLLRHALSMSTGHLTETIDRVNHVVTADSDGATLRALFALPPDREPGTVFAYNQLATYCAARILGVVTGSGLLDWLQPRLLGPLGSDEAQWMRYDGYEMAFSGLHLRTETIAKLGQVLLDGGRWGDARLLSAEWVAQATRLQMPNDVDHLAPGALADASSDWQQGYGFQFWQNRHGFRGDGAFGQFLIVWPDQDAVIVTTAEVADMQLLLDLITDHLLAAMDVPAADSDTEDAVAKRLSALALDPPSGSDAPFAGTFDVEIDVDIHGHDGGPGPAVPGLRRLVVAPDGADWLASFERHAGEVRLPVGRGRWLGGQWPAPIADHDPVPFVGAGAVHETTDGAEPARWHAELRMVQTPHTLLVDADAATGLATVAWRLPPLRPDGPDGHSLPSTGARPPTPDR